MTAPAPPQPDTAAANEALRLLIIDDDRNHAEVVAEVLERAGYTCVLATSGNAGAKKIESEDWDLILTDMRMPDMDGLAILRKAKQELPDAEVVVITGHADVKTAVQAMHEGATNYLQKPLDMTELRTVVAKAAERLVLARSLRELQRQLNEKFGFEGVVGNSSKMHEVLSKLKGVAPTSATVLIHGETGTGKELVAKALHNNSPRKNKNFVAMNCTAINENLLEDELFGHEAGAFTGADRLRKGRFEHANGGTLFLDEIGDMPLSLQAKLLRVLENQEVSRIGSNDPIKVNVRLISATHRDLDEARQNGSFRNDLYFRLNVVRINLPPLRERREDLPLLVAHFIKEMNQKHGKKVQGMAEPVRKAIAGYRWPGNVRQLRNLIESMVVQDSDGQLGQDDVPDDDRAALFSAAPAGFSGSDSLIGLPLYVIERHYIEKTLEQCGGNREEAAKRLGIGERTLYRVIQDWKLQDKIKHALDASNNSVAESAKLLNMKPLLLERKLKKWGWAYN